MKIMKIIFVVALLLMFGASTNFAQSSTERVIGSISGTQDAGEIYDLYKSSADSFRDYLSGWKFVGEQDRRVTYSFDQLYNKCLDEAKRQYGNNYPNLYLKKFSYDINEEELPDEEYHSQVIGSSAQYRKKERRKRIYTYSATVVVSQ